MNIPDTSDASRVDNGHTQGAAAWINIIHYGSQNNKVFYVLPGLDDTRVDQHTKTGTRNRLGDSDKLDVTATKHLSVPWWYPRGSSDAW